MGTPSRRPKTPDRTQRCLRAPRRASSIEHLESRLILSATHFAVPAAATPGATDATRYRIDAWLHAQAAGQDGFSFVNERYSQAQEFLNRFKDLFPVFVSPSPSPDPGPSPSPDPTPDPTPAPDPAPTSSPPASDPSPVTITQVPEGNLTRLVITGTSDNDSIAVSQSGNTLTITGNGTTSTVNGNFGELAIYGGAGDDTITVGPSVSITSLLYGGAGNNTLTAKGSAKSYIVSLGAGDDTLTGNGVNTSFWADPSDTVNASSTEVANGDVHRVSAFYQPFTQTPGAQGYISTDLNGPDLPDPTDAGQTSRMTGSLWSTGPTMNDVNQGQVGDCYFLASIQSLALMQPARLQEMAVDLGDGTYAVRFERGNTNTFVRVDADMPVTSWGSWTYAHPTGSGPIWAAIMEKAYAFFRTGANTYNSLNSGWTGSALSDLGIANTTFDTGPSSLFSTITTALANDKVVAAISNTSVPSNIPIIGSHAYTVVSTSVDSGVQYITVRNPWGFDGAGNDGNTGDGLVTLTFAQFQTAFDAGSIMA
jgi:Calpain family cysteine protease